MAPLANLKLSSGSWLAVKTPLVRSLNVINEHKFHILGLNETRLSKDITDPEVELEGFEIHRFTVKTEMSKAAV